jgi:hypothetical protein
MGVTELFSNEVPLWVGILFTMGVGVIALPKAHFVTAKWCFWIAFVLMFGQVAMWGWATTESAVVRIAVTAFLGASTTVAFVETLRTTRNIEKSQTSDKTIDNKEVNFNKTIGLSCNHSSRPAKMRPDKPLHIIQIINPNPSDPNFSIGDTFFMQSDADIKWEDTPDTFFKCTITNYGNMPAYNVSIKFGVKWREVLRENNGSHSGNIVYGVDFTSPKLNLGTGHNNEDYFYFVNRSEFYIEALPSKKAEINTPHSEERVEVELVSPSFPFSFVSLPPFERTQPKAINNNSKNGKQRKGWLDIFRAT